MTFALDYRKSAGEAESRVRDLSKAAGRQDVTSKEKRLHRLSVLGALLIAAGILGLFNSAALVQYSYGFSESGVGVRFLEMTESWHELMQRQRLTEVVERIRGAVGAARESTWKDLTMGLIRTASDDDADGPQEADLAADGSPDSTNTGDRARLESYVSAANPRSP